MENSNPQMEQIKLQTAMMESTAHCHWAKGKTLSPFSVQLRKSEPCGCLIFFGMLVFVLLPMASGVDHYDYENHKTQTNEHYHAGVVIPDRFQPICQLGPIHFAASYTAARQK
jgi:hypothetical protein